MGFWRPHGAGDDDHNKRLRTPPFMLLLLLEAPNGCMRSSLLLLEATWGEGVAPNGSWRPNAAGDDDHNKGLRTLPFLLLLLLEAPKGCMRSSLLLLEAA